MRNIRYYLIALFGLWSIHTSHGQCVADFSFDDSSLVVNFEDLSQHIVTDTIISYEWDFGDGTDSDNQSPLHIYNTAGAHTVTLAIATEDGCMDTVSYDIYICDFNLDYDLQAGCDEDNIVTLDLMIEDTYSSAGAFNVYLDDELLNDDPLTTINDTISLSTSLLADGQDHFISIQSVEHTNCNLLETITVTACVPPCNISNLKTEIINTETFNAEVNTGGYNPAVLNVTTGDNVIFQWLTDDRSVTSNPNSNGQNWDSGILNSGDEFSLYSFAPGIYTYTSSNAPSGVIEGSLVSTCPDTAYYDLVLTFENQAQIGSYQLWVDGVPSDLPDMQYSPIGFDTIELILPGDGVLHTFEIIDIASPSCNLSSQIQSPLCGVDSDCNLFIEAAQSTPCDQDSIVEVIFTVLAAGGSDQGFDLYIDNELFDEGIPYTGTETIFTKSLMGDGEEHIIEIIDAANDTCTATTTILLEDCTQPCMIINPFAGVGSNNNIVASVFNDSYSPKDITISVGDKVIWQWQTDTLRSVTASDFSFDSGVVGPGASYTSPILPIGVHRYFSEFNGMEGSITVEPNCSNGQIPIVYSFSKFGGANTGYNVFVDNIQINGDPIPYAANGNNSGNSFVAGNGEIHIVTIIDAVDDNCRTTQTFEVPFCDESTCAIFLDNPIISDCADNNTVTLNIDALAYNPTDSMYVISLDDIIIDTIAFDTSGVNPIELLVAGDDETHTLIIYDLSESTCSDTLDFTVPFCDNPCAFDPISIDYLVEAVGDTCYDGSTQIMISTQAVQDFTSEYIIEINSTSDQIEETFEYPIDGNISHIYTLIADGSEVNISIRNEDDTSCLADTSFTLYSCDPDPCNLELIDLQYDNCRDGGIMDMTITLDTFRVSDSLSIEIDGSEIFNGTYTEFYTNPTFEIVYNGEERTLAFNDLNVEGCRLSETFFTEFCPIDCAISASYTLVDSCILATDTSYAIIIAGDVLNALSDSIRIEIVSDNIASNYSYEELAAGITIDLDVLDDNPTIGIFDMADNSCRQFLSVVPPTCILDCSIDISDVIILEGDCINGERIASILIDYDLQVSDSLIVLIDDNEIIQESYPNDSTITTTIIGDGLLHTIIVRDAINSGCADTVEVVFTECPFSCEDFMADFDFTIDTLTRTINFIDLTTGGADSWSWDLGDGTVSSDATPFHTYTSFGAYTVCMEVENTVENCLATICKDIELVDIECTASFNFTVDGLTLSFTDTSTATSEITSNLWTIDNDTELPNTPNGSITAENAGDIELCLTIETASGCSDIHCELVTLVKPCNLDPSFDFDINFDTIQLSNTSTGDFTLLTWSLGDGQELGGGEIEYVYPEDGDYQVCMTIADNAAADCDFTICEDVTINSCSINAEFAININQDTLNAELIEDLGENTISWDFGNGFSANINPVQFIYGEDGDYTVCATVSDASNPSCTETHCEEISIVISDIIYNQLLGLELYPNPIARGQLITISNEGQLDLEIKMYTELGQILHTDMTKDGNQISISTANLSSGKYLVKFITSDKSVTKSVLIID